MRSFKFLHCFYLYFDYAVRSASHFQTVCNVKIHLALYGDHKNFNNRNSKI